MDDKKANLSEMNGDGEDETTSHTALPFIFRENQIRSISLDGRPWFVSADICETLGLKNPRDAMLRLGDAEKGKITLTTNGGPQEVNIVNESGLYWLAFTSRKPEAEAFRLWVTDEVLPSLRRGAAGEAQDTSTGTAYVRLPGPGRFRVSLGLNGDLSVTPDRSAINDYYTLELEALAHASCLVGRIWQRFKLLDEMSVHTGLGSNTRFQLGETIQQVHHIATSAIRTKMEAIEDLEAPAASPSRSSDTVANHEGSNVGHSIR